MGIRVSRPAAAAVLEQPEVPPIIVEEEKASIAVEASYPAQEWVIRKFGHLKDVSKDSDNYFLPKFVVDGVTWCFYLKLSTNGSFPGMFLACLTDNLPPLKVRYDITVVNQKHPIKSVFHEFVNTFEDNEYGCGADNLFKTDFSPPRLIVDDTLVLQTRVPVVKDPPCPEPVNRPLLTKSQDYLRNLLKGKNGTFPDVMLKLGDDMLPGHRLILSESSDYFRAMFKSGMSESKSDIVEIQDVAIEDMKTILDFIYGVLEAGGTPDSVKRLHSLLLAIDCLGVQVDGLMEHCIAKLIKRLSLKNVVQTYAVANRIDHHELRSACVEFADRKENRSTFRNNDALKAAMNDPDLAHNLVCDTLERPWQG